MKKQYRVNVPAVIAFDVVAESEEQAKRIAAAATYTPVEPIRPEEWREWDSADIPANLCIWAATYDTDGTINKLDGDLSGCAVEVLARTDVSDDEAFAIESAVKSVAEYLGNHNELTAALASNQTETPTDEPCPVCFREEDGKWFTPCPSDDCPSHDEVTK